MAAMIAPGASQSVPIMGTHNPPSPSSSWDQTMHDLSRQLQQICRSPTGRSVSPHGGPGLLTYQKSLDGSEKESPPTSTLQMTPPGGTPGKTVNVRHSQSEEQFAKQLSRICLTPKPRRAISEGDKSNTKTAQRQLFHQSNKHVFQETLDINGFTLENLNVLVDGSKLKVSACDNNNSTHPVWTREVDIPTEVDPTSLMCIVKDGSLVIRCCHSRGAGVAPAQTGSCNGDMIIIEDEGSEKLRILLPIPEPFSPDNIQVRTVDDKLLVVGQPTGAAKWTSVFSKSFQLPQSVDPFSITAHVNEKDQLLIEATLCQRQRCMSL